MTKVTTAVNAPVVKDPAAAIDQNENVTDTLVVDKPQAKAPNKLKAQADIRRSKQPVVYMMLHPMGRDSTYSLTKRYSIYEEVDGELTMRQIRYQKGAHSLYVDKQGENFREDANFITFNGGELMVDPMNKPLIEFLDKIPANRDAPNRDSSVAAVFYKFNPEKEKQTAYAKLERTYGATDIFRKMGLEDMRHIARNIAGLGSVWSMTDSELKHNVGSLALTDPETFLSIHENPSTKVKSLLADAVEFNFINTTERANAFSWSDSKRVIKEYPASTDGIAYMANWMLTDDEGRKFHAELDRVVSSKL